MLGRRGFLEIIAEILNQLEKKPMRKTALSYSCNLDPRAIVKYLKFMEKTNLATNSKKDTSYFVISLKGMLYLKKYNQLIKQLK